MQSVDAVYDAGVFRPTEPVVLPDKSQVRITFETVDEPQPAEERDEALEAIYEVLSHRHRSGRSDLSERHGELLP